MLEVSDVEAEVIIPRRMRLLRTSLLLHSTLTLETNTFTKTSVIKSLMTTKGTRNVR